MEHDGEPNRSDYEKKNAHELMEELAVRVEEEDGDARSRALFLLGWATGVALRAGWTIEELRQLRSWLGGRE